MASASLIIVAEGLTDIHIIRAILNKDLTESMRFFAAQGRASLITVARNLLVHEGGPVLLVMDTETFSPHLQRELQALAMMAMGGVSAPGLFEVFAFVPEIEAVFFESPAALARIIGGSVSPERVEEGLQAPKKTLARILAAASIPNLETLIRKLDEPAIEEVAGGKQAAALKEKVRRLCHIAPVPVG